MCDILPDGRVLFIHRTRRGYKGNNTAGAYFIKGFAEEIIVDQPIILVIFLINNLKLTKQNISDRNIKKAVGE